MTLYPYKKHLFICTNEKKDGSGCGTFPVAYEILKDLKACSQVINQQSEEKVRVSKSGCLGYCKQGPVAVLYPEGKWFRLVDEQEKILLKQLFELQS